MQSNLLPVLNIEVSANGEELSFGAAQLVRNEICYGEIISYCITKNFKIILQKRVVSEFRRSVVKAKEILGVMESHLVGI